MTMSGPKAPSQSVLHHPLLLDAIVAGACPVAARLDSWVECDAATTRSLKVHPLSARNAEIEIPGTKGADYVENKFQTKQSR